MMIKIVAMFVLITIAAVVSLHPHIGYWQFLGVVLPAQISGWLAGQIDAERRAP